MKMQWIIVLALMVIATGCDFQAANKAFDEAKAAEEKAKVAQAKLVEAQAQAKVDEDAKTETSAKLDARKVLGEAIAAAKADDKALFVHFTSDS